MTKGFKFGGIGVGIKAASRDLVYSRHVEPSQIGKEIQAAEKDLGLIVGDVECNTAAIYTTNKVTAAPITLTKQHLESNKGKCRAVIVNSGNANACTPNDNQVAEQICELTAKSLGITPQEVIIASTGVIGQELPLEPFERGIPALVESVSESGGNDFATAIMTTDTFPKRAEAAFTLNGNNGKSCRIEGFAKGSGMIHPNMATMLAFITTDVCISTGLLQQALCTANEYSFNMISVDGDTSTNDMVCVMASGMAGNSEINTYGEDYTLFLEKLQSVMVDLARQIAKDGEGATKLLECTVSGAASEYVAKTVAKSVISSSLVKAALGAADANWGRILCAIGYADCEFDINKVDVRLNGITVCRDGAAVTFDEDEATKALGKDEIFIEINLHSGEFHATAWGCDLTSEYVRINAEYRS